MPRKAIDYKKVIIYKLVCNDLTVKDLYIGHTTDFTNRKRNHKSCSLNPNNSNHNLKVYQMIRDNGGWNNWSMIVIEKYPCNDDLEARSRERHWYEVLNANLNMISPTLNLEKMKINMKISEKKYREKNKDKTQEYKNEKHKCRCGGCFTTANKSPHNKSKKHVKYIQENESE